MNLLISSIQLVARLLTYVFFKNSKPCEPYFFFAFLLGICFYFQEDCLVVISSLYTNLVVVDHYPQFFQTYLILLPLQPISSFPLIIDDQVLRLEYFIVLQLNYFTQNHYCRYIKSSRVLKFKFDIFRYMIIR